MPVPAFVRGKGQLRQAAALVRSSLDLLPPDELSPAGAAEMAGILGELGRLVSSAMVRYARCSGKDAAGVLAGAAGQARGNARRQLETAGAVEDVPALKDAFSRGELSIDQAAIIAPVASLVPDSAGELLALAKETVEAEKTVEPEDERKRAKACLLYTSPSPRDPKTSRMPSSA